MGPSRPGRGVLVEKAKKPPWPEIAHPYPPFGLFLRGSSLPGQNPLEVCPPQALDPNDPRPQRP